MSPRSHALSLTLLLTFSLGGNALAGPTSVYRCGPEGRSYSQTACTEGRRIEFEDSTTAQARREAQAVAQRDAQLAREMSAERVAREQAASRLEAAGIRHVAVQAREPAVGGVVQPVRQDGSTPKSQRKSGQRVQERDSRVTHSVKVPAPRKAKAPAARPSGSAPKVALSPKPRNSIRR